MMHGITMTSRWAHLATKNASKRVFFSSSNALRMPEKNDSHFPGVFPAAKKSFLQNIVDRLNYSMENHPQTTISFIIAADLTSMFGTYSLLQLSGVVISPEFALAFAASRPLRRLRMPFDLATAALLSKLFPPLSRVKVSSMFPTVPQDNSLLHKGMSTMTNIMDKYGACYMIGSRLAGLTVVNSLYFAMLQGIDIMPYLEQFGFGELGSAMGTWAASVVLASVFYPITLSVTGYAVPAIAKTLHKLKKP
ncbi:transmembrane protein [Thraustotheca clavata]|uniref:Transmembrane protein n=1 Tax=Thraustotheca clavata TaxID=74557 RepID=A0A1V9ZWZ6_9STRA|nr:transmembrane protein [Thraustotheca clavata]